MPAELLCHRCGYDLRAHPPDGKCPECGEPVAESRRAAAVPRRPAWGNSDPRWRRRMLAGVWILVLLPLIEVLKAFGWASNIPVPTVFGQGAIRTLDDTLLCFPLVHQPLIFCIGLVLLFAKERGRRHSRLDWTRRWGVLCSYVVLLLSAAQFLFLAALVLTGIAALFLCMSLKCQPEVTPWFVAVGTGYLRYGPYPKHISFVVLDAFSSIAILLAYIPLFEALRSSGPKRLAAILLAPLALFSLMHLAHAGTFADVLSLGVYFRPHLLVSYIVGARMYVSASGPLPLGAFGMEAAKWCVVLAIALWLSIAQLAAWGRGRKR